jgi:hypothetical protein
LGFKTFLDAAKQADELEVEAPVNQMIDERNLDNK